MNRNGQAYFLFFLLTFLISGCATAPTRMAIPQYNIAGTTYLPLAPLCDSRGIQWEYDTFTRSVVLNRDAHRISMRVADELVLVDGQPTHLRHPVDLYQGTVVVPLRFREQVLDVLFKAPAAPVTQARHFSKIKKVVLDAGHGGIDPGAIGRTGLREKDVTLDVVKRLSSYLQSMGVEVVLTRSSDRPVSLPSRVAIANASRADLFISIHANANRARSLSGFEVYYVSPSVNDSLRALSAAKSVQLNFSGSSFASSSLDLKATLWDMILTNSRSESITLAGSICRTMSDDMGVRILGVKDARYYVLKGTRLPAVLVEIGFLSNAEEERMLKNSFYRQQIAEALAAGMRRYEDDFKIMEVRK